MTVDDRAAEHRSRANQAFRHRKWAQVQSELEALLTITPDDAIAWNNLGVALERQGKAREAVDAYAHAAALAPIGGLPRRNLVNEMQRYLGFAAAIVLFRIIDLLLQVLPLSPSVRGPTLVLSLVLLTLGALVYYQRRREMLPDETWRAYQSEMARTRRLRYGGLAFVFVGFLVFAFVVALIVLLPVGGGDGAVVLVIAGGLCWLIAARILWRRVIAARLESR